MKENFSWKKMGRVIFIMGFITVPAVAFSGYVVYILRDWITESYGYEVSDSVYLIVLFVAVMGTLRLTSGRLITELHRENEPEQ